MVAKLMELAIHNRLVVILLAIALFIVGVHSFLNVNVEAYPDPAPAIVEVIAQYPGLSAEEVERQVTIPLEVALAGMPGLDSTRSKSLFGLAHLRNQFEYGVPYLSARQEVLNRLATVDLPAGVTPQISPNSPTGEIVRYTLSNPRDADGSEVYDQNDLKSLQDWTLRRIFRRVPRIADIGSYGGTTKRYEIQPDPARMQQYGITLEQLQNAIRASNANVGGAHIVQGDTVEAVRSVGLFGLGQDPMERALTASSPAAASDSLRRDEDRRLQELRQVVLASTNNVPIRIADVVEGGPLAAGELPGDVGVAVGHQPRLGRVMLSRVGRDNDDRDLLDEQGHRRWQDESDVVQGIVLLRKGEKSLAALKDVDATINSLNTEPGRLLPGVRIDPYYDRKELIHATTETVRENLLTGMILVSLVLIMFLSNVRCALIVAINVPLALLFAFSVLYLRGRSANLLSIGAVDFGIIVDSSVIMVENVYRHVSAGHFAELPWTERILRSGREIERNLFFSTAIMVCAFIPLFSMQGPEGQIFGPMADTYAFALGGALLLAVTLSPVLCELFLRNVPPCKDHWLLAALREGYIRQLRRYLHFSGLTLTVFGAVVLATLAALPFLGREFMPQLEEGNLYIRGTFPLNASLDDVTKHVVVARDVLKQYPEVKLIVAQIGRPDDGTDPTGFYNAEFFVPLSPVSEWPIPPGHSRRRNKAELVAAINEELSRSLIGVGWNFSQNIRDNVLESLSGVKGENSVKIFGPDLNELERLADRFADALQQVEGIKNVGVFRIMGQANLTLPVDRQQCAMWDVSVQDVQNVIQTAVGGLACSHMIEGERNFDITLRWPEHLRNNETAILQIPVDVGHNVVASGDVPRLPATSVTGPSVGPSAMGTTRPMPSITGSNYNAALNNISHTPRRRLGDLVMPLGSEGELDPQGSFVQPGASTIYRAQGNRFIAVKFDVHGRDLGGAVAEAQRHTAELVPVPYRVEWSGEFEEMQRAEQRLLLIVPLSLALIVILLYFNFRSVLDVALVLTSVLELAIGGVWALLITHTNFSISAAVGFISIFGVGIMDGMLLVSQFHRLRLQGLSMDEAILEGARNRYRPVLMTILTAIFGLLPAALSTRIGAQTQQPLAIVVIGGMLTAVLLTRYITPVLYCVFRKAPPVLVAAHPDELRVDK